MARRGGLETPILELCITAKPYYNGIFPEFPAGGEMDFDDILDIAEAAGKAGFRRIILTGSEPLRHPDIVDICIEIGRMRDFVEIGISTMGAELRNMSTTLKGAGVNLLEIRLDTLQKIKYEFMAGGNMSHVLKGISAAEKVGFLIRTMTRIIGGTNEDEAYDFCDVTKRHCFEQWFIELPQGSANRVSSDFIPGIRRNLREIDRRDGARRFKVESDAGLICLAQYEDMNRVRVSADMMLSAHDEQVSLKGMDMDALTEKLRWAFEPDKRMRFGIQLVEA